jgi:hypothetical protein
MRAVSSTSGIDWISSCKAAVQLLHAGIISSAHHVPQPLRQSGLHFPVVALDGFSDQVNGFLTQCSLKRAPSVVTIV